MSSAPQRPTSDQATLERYSAGALAREEALCCPVDYDPQYLKIIPDEVLERDYGCGDPSRYVGPGDRVLDLGSGGGKICFIASQIVGSEGRAIGVDMNAEMLELARKSAPAVAKAAGYSNVEFRRGRIQDLSLDLDALDKDLRDSPVANIDDFYALQDSREKQRRESPMIPDRSMDIVVSNCVLNLVRDDDKEQLIREIYRVLDFGGRIAISDIVSDEEVPEELKADPELWSGCISGAFFERDLLGHLETAGFYGITIDKWEEEPFAVVNGIEFRSVTITAHKGGDASALDANEAVIYRGPWKRVEDDNGNILVRGERTAVSDKTFQMHMSAPYAGETIPVPPRIAVPVAQRKGFDCCRSHERTPRETKGEDFEETRGPGRAGGACC